MAAEKQYTFEVTRDKDNQIGVSVKVDTALYNQYREEAFTKLSKEVKVQGFRPGKAPRAKIEAKIGNDLYAETIRNLLPEVASEIVEAEELNPVTQLDYDVQKFSEAEGIEFSFEFTNYPEVTIPDITKLTVEADVTEEVTEKEIDDVVQRLYHNELHEQNPEHEHKEDEELDISKVTDEMVAKWDVDGAKTVKELRTKIADRLKQIKKEQNSRLLESKILEELVAKSKFSIPSALLDQQTNDMIQQYMARIDDLDIPRESFLAAQGLTEEKLKEQKQEEAERRISVDLVLNQVAKEHDLIPGPAEIDAQIDAIEEESSRERMDTFNGRRYILTTLLQANALKKLQEVVTVKPATKADKKKSK